MGTVAIVFFLLLNFGISFWNAYVAGKVWAETKAAGGWHRFMTWMAAIQSASGFTWCYLLILLLGANAAALLPVYWVKIGLELGFVILIPGLLFSGLMITVDSWARAYREGGVLNYGVAAYNTYAQYHNTMSAIGSIGEALGDIFEAFSGGSKSSSSDDDNGGQAAILVIGLVICALAGGIITTAAIISRFAGSERLLTQDEMRRRQIP